MPRSAPENPAESALWSPAELAREFGISRETVRRRLVDVPHEVVGKRKLWRLKDAGPAIMGVDGKLDAHQEIAKLNRARREQTEMRTEAERGTLIPAAAVTERVARVAGEVVAILDGIPNKLRRANPELTAGDLDVVRAEIAEARNRMADVSAAP